MARNSPVAWVTAVPAGAKVPQLRMQRPLFLVTSPIFRAFSKGQTTVTLSDRPCVLAST